MREAQGEIKLVQHQTREIPLQGQSKSQLIIALDTAGGGTVVRHKQMGSWDLGSCFQLDNEAEVQTDLQELNDRGSVGGDVSVGDHGSLGLP